MAFRIYTLADSGFFLNFLYQDGFKSTVFWVFEDLKFKILEGYNQNWCFPDSAQLAVLQLTGQSQENTNFGPNLLKGVSSKPSGNLILGPDFCFSS